MRLRLNIAKVLQSRTTEIGMTIIILISLIQLALDSPILDPLSKTNKVLSVIDDVTMAFFTIEVIAKIFAYGFFMNGENSYMRELWNILDFIILTFSYICLWP